MHIHISSIAEIIIRCRDVERVCEFVSVDTINAYIMLPPRQITKERQREEWGWKKATAPVTSDYSANTPPAL